MNNKFLRYPLYLLLFVLAFVACDSGMDDVEVDPPENEYLMSTELVNSYSTSEINGFINLAILLYPDQKEELEVLKNYIETGVKVYKITYNTTFSGNELQASGIACIPDQAGSYPILSYQNGTNTLHSEAPTEDPNNQLFQILQMMGSTGFIICLPDYLGFGESDHMFHPYLHKESTVQSVVDMLRAIDEMVAQDENIAFNDDLYISGYSQGGWSTMVLQEAIEKKYASEFNLKASVCGAGPYNLTTINEYVTNLSEYPMPFYFGYIFNTYTNVGLTTPMDEVFQQPYADRIPTLYNGTMSGGEINAQLTKVVPDLFTSSYISSWDSDSKFAPVLEMLEENSVAAYNTKVPTLLTHGTADDYVPPIVSSEIYNDFMSLGVSSDLVKYMPLEGMDHGDAVLPTGLASITWFIELKNN